MSEFINNISLRQDELLAFSEGIINGGKRKEYIAKYQDAIDNLAPNDVMVVVHKLIENGYSVETVKNNIGKILNIFFVSLKNYKPKKVQENSFLYFLMEENKKADELLQKMKTSLKNINKNIDEEGEITNLINYFTKFSEFEKHYDKKENILFPYIEKHVEDYKCLQVMWAFHDEIRGSIKATIEILKAENFDLKELNRETGKFFFSAVPIIFREDFILFPAVNEQFHEDDFAEMHYQSFEIGFSFIEAPEKPEKPNSNADDFDYSAFGKLFVDLETGILEREQIKLLINHLPIDITYIDENDVVKFFSNPKHRFFTRSKAIIGRTVQNCHPHESVHIVDKIVNSFKSGKKDSAKFWIQMKGRFILINYYAIRNEKGEYKGVIEVSQDVTEIRKLEGEQRLLSWKD